MAADDPPTRQHLDRDGVQTEVSGVRRSVWLLALAITLVGTALLIVFRPVIQSASSEQRAPRMEDRTVDPPAKRATATPLPRRAQGAAPVDAPRVAATASPLGPKGPPPSPQSAPVFDATPSPPPNADTDEPPNEPSGVALFPPRGTKPIQVGIVVPDDFELPPGYVRHYQTTDAGHLLPPILMFHPDYHPVDEHGAPLPLPEDRIVPPEMAPPGLPIQMLEVAPEQQTPALRRGAGADRAP